ncbi:purine and uridine phosphorylase [Sanghuangporus baumii]|uniref:Purine and uridine phosphorylase n=1 Tax=Sanghuangporus baumii TaxID=108892 RepID=A0A9Q5I3Q5_SANBA|nr:purine and uridine phosphorylase [Sanghuangporus baumii]
MKETFTNANFPRTADGRVYHLGVTVGAPSRAETISRLLDQGEHSDHHGDVYRPVPAVFRLSSERGFLTITGRFRGVPISIVSIGMGYPNMDFFVREVRECVEGDLVIVRLGSCGGLTDHPVGTLVVPTASVVVRRNYDYNFLNSANSTNGPAYQITKPVAADPQLQSFLANKLRSATPLDPPATITDDAGRQTSFPDHNETLIDDLIKEVPGLATLEMETFHLLHLASVWRPRHVQIDSVAPPAPPTSSPVSPSITPPPTSDDFNTASNPPAATSSNNASAKTGVSGSTVTTTPRIRAASVQMIFAQRRSQDFITPLRVAALEEWSGRVVLEALTSFHIPAENLHAESGTVWEKSKLHLG